MPAESRHLRSNGFETAMLIAFKLKLALVCAAGLAGPLAVAPLITDTGSPDAGPREGQAIVQQHPGAGSYRAARDFTRAGKQAAPPLLTVRFETPPAIIKPHAKLSR